MKSRQDQLNGEVCHAARQFFQVWLLLLPCMVLVWTGCEQEAMVVAGAETVAATAADMNPAGTYALVSVDGNMVPCTVQHDGHTLAVKSGTFIINADGTCSSKVVFSPPSGPDATREVKATYTRQASKLTMRWERAGMTTGTVEGDTFTMNNEGMIFAYRK